MTPVGGSVRVDVVADLAIDKTVRVADAIDLDRAIGDVGVVEIIEELPEQRGS